ncbi:MAG: 3' terminal RNA ribose 2'-O-methyltransferase Hen1 [Bacteroidetes bacterium]|nr:3' terminal RNA ribose 2'-O-methyltransferase Hen1 [Bacteroidota bacterium]
MFLSISTTHTPATDLGYLLHKHPARVQSFRQPFGTAHIFYPEASDERCTAALLVEVDPVGLVRGKGASAEQYVNDRPYVAASHLAVALGDVYGTALSGVCKTHPDLAASPMPLSATVAAVRLPGGEATARRLFEPLGYAVEVSSEPLDAAFPEWGESPYVRLSLSGTVRLRDLLVHLAVLLPALDGAKHYFVGDDEVEKLLRRGEGWLAAHPEHAWIAARYLKRRPSLVRQALAQLVPEEAEAAEDAASTEGDDAAERPTPSLHAQRLDAVRDVLAASGAARVLDLGCGEGLLLRRLMAERQFSDIVGMDVSLAALEKAERRLRLDRLPPTQRKRLTLLHGSLVYRDARLEGFDAAAVVEVIEHLDPFRLDAFERALFAEARPGLVALTSPNREYNALFEGMAEGAMRHTDHRFEWTRAEFRLWAERVAEAHGYTVEISGIGPDDATHGAPSQLAVFRRAEQR